jgi:hypothetical protein
MAFAKRSEEKTITIQLLEQGTIEIYFVGKSWLFMNRMPKKAMEQLLLPPLTRNRASRQSMLKHDPVAEFRDSIYRCRDDKAPTLVHIPNNAFKKAMAQAALDTPGATKAEIGRHVQVIDETVHIYGTPHLDMRIVRQAGINKTPDVRTRAVFKQWGGKVTVQYTRGIVRENFIANLMANAGIITGIGDGRIEKGTFAFGAWDVVNEQDQRLMDLMKHHGRKAQLAAMENPIPANEDTEELLAWFEGELIRRETDRSKPKKSTTLPAPEAIAASTAKRIRKNGGVKTGET